MRTDELIGLLGASVEGEPVRRPRLTRRIGLAAALGAAGALGIALLALGVRPDLLHGRALGFLVAKVAFSACVGGLALCYLARLARPGGERRVSPAVASLPFAAVILLAVLSLASAPPSHWAPMLAGEMWLECLLSIPVIAVVPFAVLVWVVRRFGAPTDLVRAGALVGLASGALSAMGYALHCVDDTIPFVAVWYGGTIALCTLAGAILGPRLLRW
ncbi:NrsF family protein [Methylobacterium sp. JK268]